MANRLFLVSIGGALGSVLRYLMSGAVQRLLRDATFPYGTLCVNVLGCLVVGMLSQLAESRGAFTGDARLFLVVGLLGGFTTFSAFGNETMNLLREAEFDLALANALGSVVLGLGAVWLGRAVAFWVWR